MEVIIIHFILSLVTQSGAVPKYARIVTNSTMPAFISAIFADNGDIAYQSVDITEKDFKQACLHKDIKLIIDKYSREVQIRYGAFTEIKFTFLDSDSLEEIKKQLNRQVTTALFDIATAFQPSLVDVVNNKYMPATFLVEHGHSIETESIFRSYDALELYQILYACNTNKATTIPHIF